MAISLKPWERIHIDFCCPFRNHMYLIVLDAYSKWPEVIRMSSSTSTSETTKVLLSLFSRHGLPDKLVSDNGPQFTSTNSESSCQIVEFSISRQLLLSSSNQRRSRVFCLNL